MIKILRLLRHIRPSAANHESRDRDIGGFNMPFPMEHQLETDWCWNAVAVSVEHYFDAQSQLTQPDFAVRALGVPLEEANQPFFLSTALENIGKLHANPPGFLSFAAIQEQLHANLPVCVHIAWNEGGSHFVVITGYQFSPAGDPQVLVSDPILKDSNVVVWDYDSFVLAYSPSYTNAEGIWVETCLVRP
jgi:hypothetical protein